MKRKIIDHLSSFFGLNKDHLAEANEQFLRAQRDNLKPKFRTGDVITFGDNLLGDIDKSLFKVLAVNKESYTLKDVQFGYVKERPLVTVNSVFKLVSRPPMSDLLYGNDEKT